MAKFTDRNILDKFDDLEEPSTVKIYTKTNSQEIQEKISLYL
ncbi:MAG: hypothetical protein ACM3UL_00025 [Ignavibacteria bacterium]